MFDPLYMLFNLRLKELRFSVLLSRVFHSDTADGIVLFFNISKRAGIIAKSFELQRLY